MASIHTLFVLLFWLHSCRAVVVDYNRLDDVSRIVYDSMNMGGGMEPPPRPSGRKHSSVASENAQREFVSLDGGVFVMGCNDTDAAIMDEVDGESPARWVRLDPFRIQKYTVTNAQFSEFVEQTGYITEAERYGWSFSFENSLSEQQSLRSGSAATFAPWWVRVDGAWWKHPQGPDSSVEGAMDHPVTQMSWNDASAFCSWFVEGGRLPTEPEWEYAARGGNTQRVFPWGDEMMPDGEHRMNIWQSNIPQDALPEKNFLLNGEYYLYPDGHIRANREYYNLNGALLLDDDSDDRQLDVYGSSSSEKSLVPIARIELEGWDKAAASIQITQAFYRAGSSDDDGYTGTAPVDAYGPQNDFGLYNMVGNVWEWTADWWTTAHTVALPYHDSPKGPETGCKKVLKGGSFICNWLTCPRMRPSGRKGLPPDSGSDSLGFRCAM